MPPTREKKLTSLALATNDLKKGALPTQNKFDAVGSSEMKRHSTAQFYLRSKTATVEPRNCGEFRKLMYFV
jgi:hypothetical protein